MNFIHASLHFFNNLNKSCQRVTQQNTFICPHKPAFPLSNGQVWRELRLWEHCPGSAHTGGTQQTCSQRNKASSSCHVGEKITPYTKLTSRGIPMWIWCEKLLLPLQAPTCFLFSHLLLLFLSLLSGCTFLKDGFSVLFNGGYIPGSFSAFFI